MKILQITEKKPTPVTLPDGTYTGKWGGHVIELKFNNKEYELETEEGVKGFDINVVVTIKDGIATFTETKN